MTFIDNLATDGYLPVVAIYDLVCEGPTPHYFNDVYVPMHEGKPLCSICSAPTKKNWQSRAHQKIAIQGDGYGSAPKIDMGVYGKVETREEFNRIKAQIEARFPGERLEITEETPAQKQARLDQIRHRSHMKKKQKGCDEQTLNAVIAEQKVAKNEALAKDFKQNLKPGTTKVKDTHTGKNLVGKSANKLAAG